MSFLLLLAGLALLWGGRRRSGGLLGVAGLAVLGLCSFTSFGFALIGPLEERFVRPSTMPAEVSTIIMLGGATLGRVSSARQLAELSEAGDRLTETLYLAQAYPQAKVLLSGGEGLLVANGEPEAITAQRFFERLGIAPDRLILEGKSRNTDENAELSRELIGNRPGAIILVTSAFHMPRSVGLFRAAGVDVVAWPSDYRSTGAEGFGIDIVNPVYNMETSSVAIREWIGLLIYRLTGRIAEVLPAQASN